MDVITSFQDAAIHILQHEERIAERVNDYGDMIRMYNNDGTLLFRATDADEPDWKQAGIFDTVDIEDLTSQWQIKEDDTP